MTETRLIEKESAEQSAIAVAKYVKDSLVGRSYAFDHSEVAGVETLHFSGTKFEIMASVLCGKNYITFLAYLPLLVEEHSLAPTLQKLNSLNSTLAIGGYEVHKDSRKVCFKIGIAIPPLPSPELLERLLVLAISSIDSATSDLLEIILLKQESPDLFAN